MEAAAAFKDGPPLAKRPQPDGIRRSELVCVFMGGTCRLVDGTKDNRVTLALADGAAPPSQDVIPAPGGSEKASLSLEVSNTRAAPPLPEILSTNQETGDGGRSRR